MTNELYHEIPDWMPIQGNSMPANYDLPTIERRSPDSSVQVAIRKLQIANYESRYAFSEERDWANLCKQTRVSSNTPASCEAFGNVGMKAGTAIAHSVRCGASATQSRAQSEEDDMTTSAKRVEAAAEVLGGKIRGGFGKLIGDKQMQVAGKAHVIVGKAKQQLVNAAERVKGKK